MILIAPPVEQSSDGGVGGQPKRLRFGQEADVIGAVGARGVVRAPAGGGVERNPDLRAALHRAQDADERYGTIHSPAPDG